MLYFPGMKLVVIYKPNSDHSTEVETYLHDLQSRIPSGIKTEIINGDTRIGMATASLYDILRYPGILVTRDDGVMLHSWEGGTLPLMDEVAGYLNS